MEYIQGRLESLLKRVCLGDPDDYTGANRFRLSVQAGTLHLRSRSLNITASILRCEREKMQYLAGLDSRERRQYPFYYTQICLLTALLVCLIYRHTYAFFRD